MTTAENHLVELRRINAEFEKIGRAKGFCEALSELSDFVFQQGSRANFPPLGLAVIEKARELMVRGPLP